MRASSVEWEINISLSPDELRLLRESPPVEKIKRYKIDGDRPLDEIPLKLERGKTSRYNTCLALETTPNNKHWVETTAYTITLSDLAYTQLEQTGSTGERLFENSSCKILIQTKSGPEGI